MFGYFKKKSAKSKSKCCEKLPKSSKILMSSGFIIIIWNMIFGLLPISICRSRIFKPCWFSFARIYNWFFICLIIFLTITFFRESISIYCTLIGNANSIEFYAAILTKGIQSAGFLFLNLRGLSSAKYQPELWTKLSHLFQIAVVTPFGVKYKGIKKMRKTNRKWWLFSLILVLLNEVSILYMNSSQVINNLNGGKGGFNKDNWEDYFIMAGFLLWDSAGLFHVLVSMYLSFLVYLTIVSLRAVNEQLIQLCENFDKMKKNKLLNQNQNEVYIMEKNFISKLNNFKNCYMLAEEITNTLSSCFGTTILIEIFILFFSLLSHFFLFLSVDFWLNNYQRIMTQDFDILIGSFIELGKSVCCGIINFYFAYKLSVLATILKNESCKPTVIIKRIRYMEGSKDFQNNIFMFKSDMHNSKLDLTAGHYFAVRKSLIISLLASLTTYLVVILQFKYSGSNLFGLASPP